MHKQSIDSSRPSGVHTGVPGFFRACCWEATRGGTNGYFNAGWALANAIGSESPYDLETEDWQEEVETLKSLLANGDDEGVWNWYRRHYPRAMTLVPARRREQFVAGVHQAWEDGRVEV